MFKRIKQKKLQKRINANIAQRDVSQRNSKVKKVGFLIDESLHIDTEKLYDFSTELQLQHKDILIFVFVELQKKVPTMKDNEVSNKDFSWNGTLHNTSAATFLNTNFDVLIAMHQEKNVYIDLMVSESKANFKVGLENATHSLYDLILQLKPTDLITLKSELKKYLTVLNKL